MKRKTPESRDIKVTFKALAAETTARDDQEAGLAFPMPATNQDGRAVEIPTASAAYWNRYIDSRMRQFCSR